jgi:hypothetical protein
MQDGAQIVTCRRRESFDELTALDVYDRPDGPPLHE